MIRIQGKEACLLQNHISYLVMVKLASLGFIDQYPTFQLYFSVVWSKCCLRRCLYLLVMTVFDLNYLFRICHT